MIEVKDLTKRFDDFTAVDSISFSVEKGDVLGFLGPNGAGKSTTMKMITCFIPPSEGDATVCGNSVLSQQIEVRENIGYMPENAPLYEDMNVTEFLTFMAELRKIPREKIWDAVNKVIETCHLKKVQSQMIETLSKGYKRRVALAQSLIHDPPILILDEPTDGLDPNQKHDVRELIKKLSKDKCIILSTHILEEVDAVCSRAIIISEGKMRFNGKPEELKSKSETGKMEDVFRAITTGETVSGVTL